MQNQFVLLNLMNKFQQKLQINKSTTSHGYQLDHVGKHP